MNIFNNLIFDEFDMLPAGLGPDFYDQTYVAGPDGTPINADGKHPDGDYTDLVGQPIKDVVGLVGQIDTALKAAYGGYKFDPNKGDSFFKSARGLAYGAVIPGNQFKVPYAIQGNIGVQRELRAGTVLSVDYIYNHGVGLPFMRPDFERRRDLRDRKYEHQVPEQLHRARRALGGDRAIRLGRARIERDRISLHREGRERPSGARRAVADPVPRTRAEACSAIVRVGETAAVEGQAAAADAALEPGPQQLELGDPSIDARDPGARQTRPVPPGGRAVGGELGELRADLLERQPDALRKHDEGDSAEHRPPVAAVSRARSLRGDQASLLIEAKRRRSHAAAPRDLADRQQAAHDEGDNHVLPLTSS